MNNKLLKPTHLKSLCTQYDLTPSKKYGQNYLISEAPIKKMIEAADIQKDDHVIEIGPGFGVLTFALADAGAHVFAFEIEKKLETYWDERLKDCVLTASKRRLKDFGDIKIIWGNALKQFSIFNFQFSNTPYKVVANLPYQITSHVLRTLLELKHKPESITVMVQKEVAERIVAKPGDMSLLSVSVQYYGTPKIVTKVSAGNFWPAPKVDSAVISIKVKGKRKKSQDEDFFRIVRAGFSNKRKQVWSNMVKGLKLDGDTVKAVLKEVAGNEKIRAQELSIEQWECIVEKLVLFLARIG